jgi:DNA-binding response OmpR family regulator
MLTHVEGGDRVQALGVENSLAKPFTVDELVAKLDRVFEHAAEGSRALWCIRKLWN